MNLAEPIFQSYIYTDVYNSLGGGNMAVAGIPVIKLLDTDDAKQTGGTGKTRIGNHLSVPAGLVLIETSNEKSQIDDKLPSQCEVVPDDVFEQLILLASVSTTRRKKQTKSRRPEKGVRGTKRSGQQGFERPTLTSGVMR